MILLFFLIAFPIFVGIPIEIKVIFSFSKHVLIIKSEAKLLYFFFLSYENQSPDNLFISLSLKINFPSFPAKKILYEFLLEKGNQE